jgi:hypothetical protein
MKLFGFNLVSLKMFFLVGTFLTLATACLIGYRLLHYKFLTYFLLLFLVAETAGPFWGCWWGGFRFYFGLLGILFVIEYFKNRYKSSAFIAGAMVPLAFFTSIDIGIALFLCIFISYLSLSLKPSLSKNEQELRHFIFFLYGLFIAAFIFCLCLLRAGALLSYLESIYIISTNHMNAWGQIKAGLNNQNNIFNIFSIEFKIIGILLFYITTAIYEFRKWLKNKMQWQDYSMTCLVVYGLLLWVLSFRAEIGPQFQMAIQPALILLFCVSNRTLEILLDYLNTSKGSFINIITKIQVPGRVGLSLAIFCTIFGYLVFSEKVSYKNTLDFLYYQTHKADFIPIYNGFIPTELVNLAPAKVRRTGDIKVFPDFTYIESASSYITSVTKPDEQVFTFPDLGICNFLADRACVSRFGIAIHASTCQAWKEELLFDLKRIRPRYIIGDNRLSDLARSIGQDTELLPEVIDYINSNYIIEASFGPIDILKRTS